MACLHLFTHMSAFAFSLNASCSPELLPLLSWGHLIPGFIMVRFGEPKSCTARLFCVGGFYCLFWWGLLFGFGRVYLFLLIGLFCSGFFVWLVSLGLFVYIRNIFEQLEITSGFSGFLFVCFLTISLQTTNTDRFSS